MDSRQVFKQAAVRDEFLDRFPELATQAQGPSGRLEGLEGGVSLDDAVNAAESMAEGSFAPGSAPALEAIIERFTRPVYLVQKATFVVPPDTFPNSDVIGAQLESARAALERVIPGAGRIDLRNHRLDWVGTGWVVGSDVVVTNRHVAAEFANQSNGNFAFRRNFDGPPVAATVDWFREYRRDDESRFRVKDVLWIEPEGSVDVAVLQIADQGEAGEGPPEPIELMTRAEIDGAGQATWVAVIGYPAYDSHYDAADQQRIFDGIYNVKRLAPGQVTAIVATDLLHHDATTLGGNSGSVVIDLQSGKAIGLHFGGIQGERNEAVQASRVREIIEHHAG